MSLLGTQDITERDSTLGLTIRRVEVVKLFGIYSYDLALSSDRWDFEPKLMIFYGDNGSGKTTILKLIFNLLSPEDAEGHRTYIARIPFQEFRVTLSDGTVIAATRPADNLEGAYRCEVLQNSKTILEHQFSIDADGDLEDAGPNGEERYEQLMLFLKDLDMKFHYLGDDRKVATDYVTNRRLRLRYRTLHDRLYSESRSYAINDPAEHAELSTSDDNLQQAVRRAEEFVRREAFARSTRGSENANSVYTELVQRLVSSAQPDTSEELGDLSDLREKIDKIQSRNKSFEELGLSAPLNLSKLQTSLKEAPPRFGRLITGILEPYINGISARLDALQILHDVIFTFLGHLNEFYANKRVRLHLNEGIQIIAATDQELGVNKLSSGEKQLLLLLCNALSARREASVFIIDEPEISLNIKWQRKLVRALLDCMEGSSAQFLFATHSLEIVSQYDDHRVDLENLHDVHAT